MASASVEVPTPPPAKGKLPLPPGPKGHLLVGTLPVINRDWLDFLTRAAKQYGDIFYFRFLNLPICYVSRPEWIEKVLITDSQNFIKSKDYRALERVMGRGLLSSEGDFWRRQRKLAQPAFHRERIAAYSRLMVDYAGRMLDTWHDGQVLDVHQEMMKLALEIVAQTLFGADVRGRTDEVGAALQVIMEEYLTSVTTAFLIPKFLPTPGNLRLNRALRRLNDLVYSIIQERRSSRENPGDLLSMLLNARDGDGSAMSNTQLRDEVITLFLAGHETTANALAWTWYLLAEHPAAEAKLSAELEILGGSAPRLEDLARLPYAERVIKESMRLYPPAWGIGREALKGFELNGYFLPKGTNLFISQWLMHRDARYFEKPTEFNPDRWTEEFERRLPSFAYFPFGGGPRVCIGAGFAMMEATLLLAAIAQRFRMTMEPGHEVDILPSITLRPKGGIWVRLHGR